MKYTYGLLGFILGGIWCWLLLGLHILPHMEIMEHITTPVVIDVNRENAGLVSLGHFYVTQNITIKHLDDVGLVVKWTDGAILTDNGSLPAQLIQRFEPWLRGMTGIDYNVTWEE